MRLRSRRKRAAELAYWKGQGGVEGGVPFYEWAFTEHFGIARDWYAGKRMLDVGCGPRGSLEWAGDAAERVGADPLAEEYLRLHAAPQDMRYVAARAEQLPFGDGHFDVVSCFNALDHVESVDGAVAELTRVARPGGTLLLIVDVEHEPTTTEPQRLAWTLPDALAGWEIAERRDYERPSDNMLANLRAGTPFDHSNPTERPGVLSLRAIRRP